MGSSARGEPTERRFPVAKKTYVKPTLKQHGLLVELTGQIGVISGLVPL